YNVTKNEYLGEYSSANLEEIIEYDGDFRGKFIEKGDLIFTEKNYFAQFNYYPLPVNSSSDITPNSNDDSSIKLNYEIVEGNKIKLISNDNDAIIYYTFNDDFPNIESYLKTSLKSDSGIASLHELHLISGYENLTKIYNSPVQISDGQKLNAIAVNVNNLVISNYLEGITLSSSEKSESSESSSSSSSQSNNFSINFKEDKKTDDVICEKETKICYVKSNTDTNVDLIANKVNDGNVYFAINNLTNKSNPSFNNPILISNNLKLGNNLVNYNSENTEFKVNLSQSITGNYIISSKQDNTNVDKLYFVFLPDENFEDLVKYKTLQKIINSVYCDGCKIPDWMPNGLIIDNQNLSTSDPDCKYTDDFEILCDFTIFNLDDKIGIKNIPESQVTGGDTTYFFTNLKETYFLEMKDKIPNSLNSSDVTKTFFKELSSKLNESELKSLFAIIGAESSFNKMAIGDKTNVKGPSYGLVQLNEQLRNNQTEYNKLDQYLPEAHKGFKKYQNYFKNIKEDKSDLVDTNYSVYLAYAVYKSSQDELNSKINNYNSFSPIDKLFIHFYSHQIGLTATVNFFNGYDRNKKAIMDCINNPNAYNTFENRLNCVAVIGSVRKLAWYLYANKHWNTLKGEGNNLNGTTSTDNVNLPYVMSGTSKLYIHTKDAPTTLNWENAVNYCKDMNKEVGLGYDDWYLPSKEQMTAIWNACPDPTKSRECMNNNIYNKINGWINLMPYYYWTSSEYGSSDAYRFDMDNGYITTNNKSNNKDVRCVRDHSP
ncbi:MAG: DUF1566 domain-containing protein, partial [Candidatus ainarchaeum sp.]|nr:DUF1566 domain-containing protein [Candidatus ainarchaeum sp.]